MTPSSIASYMNGVTKLRGMDFAKWKADIQMILAIMDRDHSFREDKLVEPLLRVLMTLLLRFRRLSMRKLRPSGRDLTGLRS
jgi:hypothetical protein